jgi:hypothetical protein
MTKPLQRNAIYLKRHFDAEIIVLCVRSYDNRALRSDVVANERADHQRCTHELTSTFFNFLARVIVWLGAVASPKGA